MSLELWALIKTFPLSSSTQWITLIMWHIYQCSLSLPVFLFLSIKLVLHIINVFFISVSSSLQSPLLLFLHLCNDQGIIFLPLIAFLPPFSLSNDCSYLILLPLFLSHILQFLPLSAQPPSLPLCLGFFLLLLYFFFGSVSLFSCLHLLSVIDPTHWGWVKVFVF